MSAVTVRTEVSMTKLMYGWSKYGGANHGLVKKNKLNEENQPGWTCQACGEEQHVDLPSYLIEFAPREFVRICSCCCAVTIAKDIRNLFDLLPHVRPEKKPY